ncbi:MAG TPA: alkaline phosphatase family protein [Streptosporangiaceae bacterium]|nr:alkaline phosphatase family protein [Streptosporangiaceae bacterium]
MSQPARILAALALAAAGALVGAVPAAPAAASAAPAAASHYGHIFVIVMENHSYADVIGNPATPNLNALASRYGIATNYFAVTHPSEPNYVALLGGSPSVVNSDNAYYVQQVHGPSLVSQLDHAHVSWKAYLQSLPHPGYQGICYPANCNGGPDKDPLYVSKHDGIQNFTTSLNPADWSRQVPIGQLAADLRSGHVPGFSWVIPDECHDQHGDPPFCIDSGATGGKDPQDQRLLTVGDQYLGQLVQQITSASFWAKGNNAIDVVYDEGDNNVHGGGQVANVVITSHGPRHVKAPAFYSHYSLLRTIQDNFGVSCLRHSCDASARPMTPLLKVTGSAATPFKALPVPNISARSPAPKEPVHPTSDTSAGAGWTVQRVPTLGASDNTYGAVAATSAANVWLAGNFLPDATGSNMDATLPTAAHFNGSTWSHTPVPQSGPNYGTLFGVAAAGHQAWAVGVALNAAYQAHSLVEAWNGTAWHVAATPRLVTQRDILFSATAVSPRDVWAVGTRQVGNGTFSTLIERWNGTRWSVVPSPNPGPAGNNLYSVAASGPDNVWAVGQRSDQTSDLPLVEHWNGQRWTAVSVPSAGLRNGLLQGVAVHGDQVWAVGNSDDAAHQARPLVEHLSHGHWTAQLLTGLGSGFSDINAVTVAGGTVWLAGEFLDATGLQHTLLARNDGSGWQQVAAPNPGTGDKVVSGIASAGGRTWAVGYFKTNIGRAPLVMLHKP